MTTALAPVPPSPRQGLSLARGLGWFSLVLGVTELLLPRTFSRTLGLGNRPVLLAGYGVREVSCGVGLLLGADPALWVQARIAGDALDLATLAVPFAARPGHRRADAAALLAVAGVTALDLLCARQLARTPRPR